MMYILDRLLNIRKSNTLSFRDYKANPCSRNKIRLKTS